MAAQSSGAVNTATQAAGAIGAGTEATAQATDMNRSMTTTTSTPIKGTTRAATAAATLISRAANPMEPSTPILTLEVVTTPQPSMY